MKTVNLEDLLPSSMAKMPDQKGSVFVLDDRQDDLERVRLNQLDEMKAQVLRDMGLTPQQAEVTLESFDVEGKPVFQCRIIDPRIAGALNRARG